MFSKIGTTLLVAVVVVAASSVVLAQIQDALASCMGCAKTFSPGNRMRSTPEGTSDATDFAPGQLRPETSPSDPYKDTPDDAPGHLKDILGPDE